MTMLSDETGQAPLPGMEKELFYQEPHGHGEGQTSSQTEQWFTHPDIVALVHDLFGGPPDLDPFSCAEANEIVCAKNYYTAEQDGLLYPFYGKMLVNPPWGGTDRSAVKKRGLKKLLESYTAGQVEEAVCILNANALTTAWFRPLLDFPLCIPPRRIEHYGPGKKGGAPNSGTVITYVGHRWTEFAKVFFPLGTILSPYVSKWCIVTEYQGTS